MILIALAAGLYAIGIAGYYKLLMRVTYDANVEQELMPAIRLFFAALCLVWPVGVYYNLVKEALR